jgi:YHS domain-containing protein
VQVDNIASKTQESSNDNPSRLSLKTLVSIVTLFAVFGFASLYSSRSPSLRLTSLDEVLNDECGDSNRMACCTDKSFPVLGGVDVVAYFQLPLGSEAVAGSPDVKAFLETQNGAYTFYFKNEENKELFVSDPWKYIPEVGGFDANAVAGGMGFQDIASTPKSDIGPIVDVNQWTIIHDRLYLFGNPMEVRFFTLQQKNLVSAADIRWLSWYDSRWVALFSPKADTVLNTRCTVVNDLPEFVPQERDESRPSAFVLAADAPEFVAPALKYDYEYDTPEWVQMDGCASEDEKKQRTTCCGDPAYPVLGGVDVVEFLYLDDESVPVWGNSEITATLTTSLHTYTFWFSSEENRDKFESDPWGFAPLFGGFCSFGIAKEKQYERDDASSLIGPYADFPAWARYDGHLFMFGGKGPRKFFLETPDDAIEAGKGRWEGWFGDLFDGTLNTRCFSKATAKKK